MSHLERRIRGDSNQDRLFFSLLEKGIVVNNHQFIKENVCFLNTTKGKKIIKGFRTIETLFFQFEFAWNLKQKSHSLPIVCYEYFPNGESYFKYRGYYWALMPFLEGNPLNYRDDNDQKAAFSTLIDFHKINKGFSVYGTTKRYTWQLFSQWVPRMNRFSEVIERVPGPYRPMFNELLNWGRYSLRQLADEPIAAMESEALQAKQWIHGDVAAHNFIRASGHHVHLIDLDLVAIAPRAYDYLQLVNRILVSNDWNLQDLYNHVSKSHESLSLRWFLLALIFPSDLFREWGKWLRGRTHLTQQFLLNYTVDQFYVRYPTIHQIMHMVN